MYKWLGANLVFIFTVLIAILISRSEGYSTGTPEIWGEESDRNEQSTPRSFILPATPAVTEAQERRTLGDLKDAFGPCLARIVANGGVIDDWDDLVNAKLTESIVDFQTSKGLPRSGIFDEQTRKALGC